MKLLTAAAALAFALALAGPAAAVTVKNTSKGDFTIGIDLGNEEKVETIPVNYVEMVPQQQTQTIPVTTTRMVPEEKVETIPVSYVEMVPQQRTETVPVMFGCTSHRKVYWVPAVSAGTWYVAFSGPVTMLPLKTSAPPASRIAMLCGMP